MEILHVLGQPFSDTTIEAYQYHTYQPYTSNLNYNDEIRINIQDLDAYTLPCNSYIYIEGKMLTDDNKVPTKFQFINNGISYLFRELRYELNGVTIDSVRNIGLISTLKNYLSLNENQSKLLQNAGWFPKEDKLKIDTHGNFNVCIPLKIWSGFFEDFQKIIINMRQELVLIREKDDIDAIIATDETEKPKIEINKLYWNVPHILPNISEQLRLNKIVRSNTELPIKFRSWELIEYPTLNNSTRHTWPVKTTTKLESPRHIVVAFHDGRKGKMLKDMSKFDHCNLTNIRMFLNSERYPYQDLNLDFDSNRFATLYEMFANFQESYYHLQTNQPIFNPEEFKNNAPIVHTDCSRQKEIIQSGSVVLRIEFETSKSVGNNVSAYCLILHEKEFSYNPLTKIVRQQ
ncbi:uncharacterized protein LOC126891409 [Diabrotica virgifera virgifera]|uniref:Double jelly roll-like domain-containing protein n=1 Tax=Diabrotica virgifera virgifera TaxID=50390 RepID=A0ABM5L271_DIAVI|nr:uncharacterized protein LOC126890978 [Diabrotica virgifera virgifera]XP_050516539.1 uncharacterized protein LOC126891409 [Diabrotica virgifera virgifera]